jgi:hypothetical protein
MSEAHIQLIPSTRETEAILPAPKALAGRAKRTRRRARARKEVEGARDGIVGCLEMWSNSTLGEKRRGLEFCGKKARRRGERGEGRSVRGDKGEVFVAK